MTQMHPAPGSLLDRYCRIDRLSTNAPADVLTLLQRHVLRWTSSSPLSVDDVNALLITAPEDENEQPARLLCYAPSIAPTGHRALLAARVKRLAALPFFYRLNFIRQLATTCFSVNIESNHNRLAHSLGVTDCAAAILESIEGKGTRIDDIDATAILLYAFLHDTYHGPFGHMLDMLRDVIWGLMEERVDKYLLAHALHQAVQKKTGLLWSAVCPHLEPNPTTALKILGRVLELNISPEAKDYFATEIVDAAVDADRLDYLWRDAQHLMRPNAWTKDDGIRIVGGVRAIDDGSNVRLHFDASHRQTIERLLEVRKEFYTNYYENPIKHILEEMFAHAMYYALEDEGVLGDPEFAESFTLLVDDDLVHFLWELLAKPRHLISHVLLQDVLTNRPYRVIWKEGIPVDQLANISLRYNSLRQVLASGQDTLKSHLRRDSMLGLRPSREYTAIVERFVSAINSPVPVDMNGAVVEIPPQDGEQLFWLQNLYGNSFRKKLKIERTLWSRLLTSGDVARRTVMENALNELVHGIVSTYFPADRIRVAEQDERQEMIKLADRTARLLTDGLQKTPLVFISLSWIPSWNHEDLLAHSRGFGSSDVRFHKDGAPVLAHERPQIRFRDRDKDYFVMLSAPSALVEKPAVFETIRTCFLEVLRENAWLIEEQWEGPTDFR